MADSLYIDCHMHLQDQRFDDIRKAVMLRAEKAGVGRMLCNATREEDWQQVLRIASEYPAIYPFLGIHPWHVETAEVGWDGRLETALVENLCGLGETGLDKKSKADMGIQVDFFSTHLRLAAKFRRPLSVHCYGSWGLLIECLENQARVGSLPAVMLHSFSGSTETMRRLVRLGCWISFSARLIDPGQNRQRQIFLDTPLDRILLETDAPDQLPLVLKETTTTLCNEPANISTLYQCCARLRNINALEFSQQIMKNGTVFTNSMSSRR